MSDSIRIRLARETDGAALGDFLARRGFDVARVTTDGHATLVVGAAPARPAGVEDPWAAVTAWLELSARPLVPVVLREREYALAPPGD